jgi:uncharacterized protein (TIGR02996 family)
VNDGELLLKAILANPAEDTPRLVYADWLEENGQGERAEFIRWQVAHPSTDYSTGPNCGRGGDIGTPDYRHRLKEEIASLLGQSYQFATWKRGLLYYLEMTAPEWFAHGDAILAAHPLTRVNITGSVTATFEEVTWTETRDEVGLKLRAVWNLDINGHRDRCGFSQTITHEKIHYGGEADFRRFIHKYVTEMRTVTAYFRIRWKGIRFDFQAITTPAGSVHLPVAPSHSFVPGDMVAINDQGQAVAFPPPD